jgi:hypothetical protein
MRMTFLLVSNCLTVDTHLDRQILLEMENTGNLLSLLGDWISKNELEIHKSDPSIDFKDFDSFDEIYSTKLETFLIMNLILQYHPSTAENQSSEILLRYQPASSSSSSSFCSRTLKLTHLNYLSSSSSSSSSSTIFAMILNIDNTLNNLSMLLMGPKSGYRIFEQYKLISNGMELLSHLTITNRQKGTLTIKKIYTRQNNQPHHHPSYRLETPISTTECESVGHWKSTKSHSSNTLRSATVNILQPDSLPSSSRDGSVLYYPICVTLPPDRQWIVHYRYSQIRQLKKYLREEIDQLISLGRLPPSATLPHFPPREMGTLSNRALEERRIALEIFLDGVIRSGGYDCQDIVDVLAAFFEVPSPLYPQFLLFLVSFTFFHINWISF